jgi:hypothetical protein
MPVFGARTLTRLNAALAAPADAWNEVYNVSNGKPDLHPGLVRAGPGRADFHGDVFPDAPRARGSEMRR